MAEKIKSNEIHLKRFYEAPVKAVWEAWEDPKQAGQWWGPRGFSLTTHSKDLKSGGTWNYTMHGPNGVDFPNFTRYLEVEKYSRLIYDHGGKADKPPMFRVTVVFTEMGSRTEMDMTMALPTPEAAESTRIFIKKAGGDTTWDRLAEYLAHCKNNELFVINRSFDTTLDVMFEMWTNPEHLSRWSPPKGAAMRFIKADVKPGGFAYYSMTYTEHMKMYGRVNYLEFSKPSKIIYTQQFCDEHEKVTRHPLAPTWPETMLTTVKLYETGPSETLVTVTWEPHGEFTGEELETFKKARAEMSQGWTGTFDNLEEYLLK